MSVIIAALVLAQAGGQPLDACDLVTPMTFFDNMSDLPPEIQSDINKRHGIIYPRGSKAISFSDTPSRGLKVSSELSYIGHVKNQWLISYTYGGIAIRSVTVSYTLHRNAKVTMPYLMGALEGDSCTAANTFLKGVVVEAGWQR